MTFFTANGYTSIISPGDPGNNTNYYFVEFTDPNNNNNSNIIFNSDITVSYLIVGGGGGGGAGLIYTEIDSSVPIQCISSGGGGGASGQILTGNILISSNTTSNITIGSGGIGAAPGGDPSGNGGTTSFIGNNFSINTIGGQGGGAGNNVSTNPPVGGTGGTNTAINGGNGGNGAAEYTNISPATQILVSPTPAINYNNIFAPYTMNGYNTGLTLGGGGGGGGAGNTDASQIIIPPSSGQGSGGIGGSNTPSTPQINGIYGGGGGGGFGQLFPSGGGNAQGGNGGDGIVILSFQEPVLTNFISNGQDLSSIFLPIDWVQTSAPSIPWLSITSNSTGQYLFAGASQGQIYYSSNYGNTWTVGTLAGGVNVPTGSWDITCDSSGQYVVATTTEIVIPPLPAPPYYEGVIYYSINYGATFSKSSQTSPNALWGAIKSNGDGSIIVAGVFGGGIYTSSNYNYGGTWTQMSAPAKNWASIASDNTGLYLAAVVGGGGIPGTIYTSNPASSSTWTQTSAPIKDWISITSDSTGKYLAAAVLNEGIYTSSNYGSTWTQTSAPTGGWASITSDSTGQYLAAVSPGYPVYKSTNYGSTWFSQGDIKNFSSIASSADGLKLASATSGNVFVLNQSRKTNFKASNGNDLNLIFQGLTVNPDSSFVTTGFQVDNYTPLWTSTPGLYDLGKVFVNIAYPYIANGNYTVTSDSSYNTILTFIGSGSITFNYNVGTINSFVVGGGAGGSAGNYGNGTNTGGVGGNGGGGGSVLNQNLSYSINITYNIAIGNGGNGGYWYQPSGSSSVAKIEATEGGPSSISTITANGGAINNGGAGGQGGSAAGFSPFPGGDGSNGTGGTNGYGGGGGGGGGGNAGYGYGKGGQGVNGTGPGGKGSIDLGGSGENGYSAVNTGGGGGGGGGTGCFSVPPNLAASGGNGGSGIVILKFNI